MGNIRIVVSLGIVLFVYFSRNFRNVGTILFILLIMGIFAEIKAFTITGTKSHNIHQVMIVFFRSTITYFF